MKSRRPRKAQARLQARRERAKRTQAERGYRRPGSLNPRKGA